MSIYWRYNRITLPAYELRCKIRSVILSVVSEVEGSRPINSIIGLYAVAIYRSSSLSEVALLLFLCA